MDGIHRKRPKKTGPIKGVPDSISSDLASEFAGVEFGKELLKKLKEDDEVSSSTEVDAAGPIPHFYGVQPVSQNKTKYDDMMKRMSLGGHT